LSITDKNANNFTSTTMTIIISHDQGGNGQYTTDGQYNGQDLSLSNNVTSLPVLNAFTACSVTPIHGTHYNIEIDEGATSGQGTLLGTTTFTYTGQ